MLVMSEVASQWVRMHNDRAFLEFLKVNHPEMFYIFAFEIIPFYEKVRERKEDLTQKKEDYKKLCEEVKKSRMEFEQARASLAPWHRDRKRYRYTSTIFEWVLKAGLALVPILATLSILGIKDLRYITRASTGISVLFAFFCSFALVWLTSITVSGLLGNQILKEFSNTETNKTSGYENNQILHEFPSKNYKINKFSLRLGWIRNQTFEEYGISINSGLMLCLIWLSEAFLGVAIIPQFLKKSPTDPLISIFSLEGMEIFFGVGIFALINILYSINKSYREQSLTLKRERLARCRAEYEENSKMRDMYKELVDESERQLREMEKDPYRPSYRPEQTYFSEQLNILSNFAMQGKELKSLTTIYDEYQNMSSRQNTSNGISSESSEFLSTDTSA